MTNSSTDIVIIGAGHNGLTCAAYLAAAGLKVTIVEKRSVVGGAAVTEEFVPGFRNSVASYTVSLLNPQVIRDLELARHGLRIVNRPVANFLPALDDQWIITGGDGRTERETARFSQKDADALKPYHDQQEAIADLLRDLVLKTPPNLTSGNWRDALPEMLAAARLGNRMRRLTMEERRTLLELFSVSAGGYLDDWFETAPIKAIFGFDGVVGNYASPYEPGSAYVLLHHVFGESNGVKGAWGVAIGGMGAITQAMARCCESRGVDIRLDDGAAQVLLEGGKAVGVVTAKGDVIRARAVAANCHPQILYQRLIDQAALPDDFRARIGRYKSGSGTFRMNVALSKLPEFSCVPGHGEHQSAGIIIAPTLKYMDKAWRDATDHGWSREPIVEMLIPSTMDDTLAAPGAHVASLFCQQFAPQLPDGRSWDEVREEVADVIVATVDKYAPGFAASVIGRQIKSPLDLERDFGLIGGDIFHGKLTLNQIFSARPVLGHGAYRGPLKGLYMCGSGTHPGGGVSGAPGHNAAREIVADARRRRV